MQNLPGMRIRQAIQYLQRDLQRLLFFQRPPFEHLRQRLPFDVLQHHVLLAFVLHQIVNRDDIGVLQAANGARLGDQCLQRLRRLAIDAYGFQRHRALQLRIVGKIDGTVTALAEQLDDLKTADILGISSDSGHCGIILKNTSITDAF